MIIEVIATTVDEAIIIEQAGADRIELITGMAEGGLTPSYGLIKEVVGSVNIPVNVMIRPQSYSFRYSEKEIKTMVEDIQMVGEIGASGIVLGVLKQDSTIDEEALIKLLEVSGDLDVTFHRAFDRIMDQMAGLKTLFKYPQVQRVLTSGGQPSALDAQQQIKRLVELSSGQACKILAGSGLTIETINDFIDNTKVTEVHFGSAVRFEGESSNTIDPDRVRGLMSRVKN